MKRTLAVLAFANAAVYAYFQLVAVPALAPAPPPSGHPLYLVGEPTPKPVTAECRSIGPLHDADVAGLVGDWLKGVQRAGAVRSAEAAAPPAYWVVTTRKSATLASRLVQQLRAAGVADVEAVPPDAPDGETRVSLGVYADRARAERRILDLKGYALGPTIVEQPRRAMQWWVDVEPVAGAAPIDLEALLRVVPGAAGAGLAPCVVNLPPPDAPASEAPPAPAPAAPKPAGTA